MFDKKFIDEHPGRTSVRDRLESKIEIRENGCHEFIGGKDSHGYGRIRVGGHQLGAHKVSYLINVGDYDQEKHELMHNCDNPACVNPEHLRPGTHRENIHDSISKGRHTSQNREYGPWVEGGVRQRAIENGLSYYYGSMCEKHGHNLRSVVNGACVYCRQEYNLKKIEQRRVARETTAR